MTQQGEYGYLMQDADGNWRFTENPTQHNSADSHSGASASSPWANSHVGSANRASTGTLDMESLWSSDSDFDYDSDSDREQGLFIGNPLEIQLVYVVNEGSDFDSDAVESGLGASELADMLASTALAGNDSGQLGLVAINYDDWSDITDSPEWNPDGPPFTLAEPVGAPFGVWDDDSDDELSGSDSDSNSDSDDGTFVHMYDSDDETEEELDADLDDFAVEYGLPLCPCILAAAAFGGLALIAPDSSGTYNLDAVSHPAIIHGERLCNVCREWGHYFRLIDRCGCYVCDECLQESFELRDTEELLPFIFNCPLVHGRNDRTRMSTLSG